VVSFHVSFFANTFISSIIADFQFGSSKASFQSHGTNVEDKEDTKALYKRDKELYEIKLNIGYAVQFQTPFLKAIGRSLASKLGTWDSRIGIKGIPEREDYDIESKVGSWLGRVRKIALSISFL